MIKIEKDHTCCSSDGNHPKKQNFPVAQNRGQYSTTICTNHLKCVGHLRNRICQMFKEPYVSCSSGMKQY